jgi:hypothetical protein
MLWKLDKCLAAEGNRKILHFTSRQFRRVATTPAEIFRVSELIFCYFNCIHPLKLTLTINKFDKTAKSISINQSVSSKMKCSFFLHTTDEKIPCF